MRRDNFPETIAITSALAGVGTTSVARSLAAILANDLDRKVCLVETNWWEDGHDDSPTAARDATLADVIRGLSGLDDAVLPTPIPGSHCSLRIGRARRRPAVVVGRPFADSIALLAEDLRHSDPRRPAAAQDQRGDDDLRQRRRGRTRRTPRSDPERQVELALQLLTGQDTLGIIFNRTSTWIPRMLRRITVPI